MMPPYANPERVPAAAVVRLQKNFAELREAVDALLASIEAIHPARSRLQRAAALLRQEEADLLEEAEAFHRNDREPLLRHAAELRLLAHRMDGYTPAFLPDDARTQLVEKRQLLVLTAWQIAAAASGSEASGL